MWRRATRSGTSLSARLLGVLIMFYPQGKPEDTLTRMSGYATSWREDGASCWKKRETATVTARDHRRHAPGAAGGSGCPASRSASEDLDALNQSHIGQVDGGSLGRQS